MFDNINTREIKSVQEILRSLRPSLFGDDEESFYTIQGSGGSQMKRCIYRNFYRTIAAI